MQSGGQIDDSVVPLPRVLLVDDDLTFLAFACTVIESMRVQVEVSLAGRDAIHRIRSGSWARVLLDFRLPDLHGLEVLRWLRNQDDDVPVTVLTGAGNVPTAVEAARLGIVDFLEKPVTTVELIRAVDRLTASGESPSGRLSEPSAAIESDRMRRLARVVVAFMSAPTDARTVEEMCKSAGLYLAPRTFRGWCEAAGVRAAALLDLARVLRAVSQKSSTGRRLIGALDADERTVRALCARGFPGAGVTGVSDHPEGVLRGQRFVQNRQLVETIVAMLRMEDRGR